MCKSSQGGNALPFNFVNVGIAITLMNRKLTDFSAWVWNCYCLYTFITKSLKPRGK